MNSDRSFLVVIYVLIPLILITPFLPMLVNLHQRNIIAANQQDILLYPLVIQRTMGLMTPCEPSDRVYNDYEAVLKVLDEIPAACLQKLLAVNENATIVALKDLLSITDRLHVAAHGVWSSDKSIIYFNNQELTKNTINSWTFSGYRCKLILLSACNSMGHDGTKDNTLASRIMSKSGVQQVIGYKDVVDAGGAAIFASLFWTAHLWQNEDAGGTSSDDAYNKARDGIHQIICDESLRMMWNQFVVGVIVGAILTIVGILIPPAAVVLPIPIQYIVNLYITTPYEFFLASLNSAYYNVAKYGSDVSGLTYWGGGGGGGDLPF